MTRAIEKLINDTRQDTVEATELVTEARAQLSALTDAAGFKEAYFQILDMFDPGLRFNSNPTAAPKCVERLIKLARLVQAEDRSDGVLIEPIVWILNLVHGVSKGGLEYPVGDEEWASAYKALGQALADARQAMEVTG